MQTNIVMSSTPGVATTSPSATAGGGGAAKPGTFAAIFDELQAALAPASVEDPPTETEAEASDADTAEAVLANAVAAGTAGAGDPSAPGAVIAGSGEAATEAAVEGTVPPSSPAAGNGGMPGALAESTASRGADGPAPAVESMDPGQTSMITDPASRGATTSHAAQEASVDETPVEAAPQTQETSKSATAGATGPGSALDASRTESATRSVASQASTASGQAVNLAASSGTTPVAAPSEPEGGAKPARPHTGPQGTVADAGVGATSDAEAIAAEAVPAIAALEESAASEDLSAASKFARALRATSEDPSADGKPAAAIEQTPTAAAVPAGTEVRTDQSRSVAANLSPQGPGGIHEATTDVAVRSIRYMVANGERQLTVRLHPESLGQMTIQIAMDGDGLEVRLAATRPAAFEALEHHAGSLRDALAREGIDVTRVTVTTDLSGQSHHQAGGRHAGAEASHSRPAPAPTPSAYRGAPALATSEPRPARHSGALDLYA